MDETDGLKNDIVWFGSWLPVGAAIVGGILLLMAIGLFLKVRMDAERA